jgi:hypothetical protein
MENPSRRSTLRASAIAVCLCATLTVRPAEGHPTSTTVDIPRHLVIDDQYYDATPYGFRAYLETIRPTNPQLYAQLAPDADRLASRLTTGRILLVGGFALALASVGYGVLGRNECTSPPITDPNFAAGSAAWDACNRDNMTKSVTFGLIGLGAAIAGMAASFAVTPSRNELLELVNRHNRDNPHPMQLQLGYDPIQHVALGGALFTF